MAYFHFRSSEPETTDQSSDSRDRLEADARPFFSGCRLIRCTCTFGVGEGCLNSLQVTECSYTIPPVFGESGVTEQAEQRWWPLPPEILIY